MSATDPPVRSIRIATTLSERFRDILTHHGLTDTAALELRIGEAQQIYPEIWRHLDEASAALAERGLDIKAFEKLRAGELAILGVTEVHAERHLDYISLMAGRLRYQEVKTATFNIEGYRRAAAACKALMAAMPDIDWAALARAEDKEIAAVGSLWSGKYLGIAKFVAVLAVLAVVALGVRKLAMSSETTEQAQRRDELEADAKFREERAAKRAIEREARKAAYAKQAEAIKTNPASRQARIRELTHWLVAHPCDARFGGELVELLGLDGQQDTADAIKKRIDACP